MLRVDVSLDLGVHVVIGVGRLNVQQEGFIRQLHFTTHTIFHKIITVLTRYRPIVLELI